MKLYDMSFRELSAGGPGSGRHALREAYNESTYKAAKASDLAQKTGKLVDHAAAAEAHMRAAHAAKNVGNASLAKFHTRISDEHFANSK